MTFHSLGVGFRMSTYGPTALRTAATRSSAKFSQGNFVVVLLAKWVKLEGSAAYIHDALGFFGVLLGRTWIGIQPLA